MASQKSFLLLLFTLFLTSQSLVQSKSMSFPLTFAPLSKSKSTLLNSLTVQHPHRNNPAPSSSSPSDYNYRSSFKYSMALIISLPIGTPAQTQPMVLDTGSQLSWIQCHGKSTNQKSSPKTTSFDPSQSSSYSPLPCNHPICKPRIPDFTLPTTCDPNRLCHYSYFYADGTLAEGNLVREKITFENSKTTPPLILGCAASTAGESGKSEGILGMNLGRLSFVSQAKVSKFSYCVPRRHGIDQSNNPIGRFYLGRNPNSNGFKYINLLDFPQNRGTPNYDPLAYTVGLAGIKIGGKRLNISESVFRPDGGGSGQTFIDSGTEYTFLVEAAYAKVREAVARVAGSRMKGLSAYGGSLDMCFDDRDAMEIGRLLGDMAFEFENGVEVLVGKEGLLDRVGNGVHCLGIGRSEALGVTSNIIGNFHQQDHWVEFDVANRKIGFGVADCSRSV